MTKHVLVVGAGIIGLCTAFYCTERGWRVTVCDSGGEDRDGCSFGNAGMVVPSHFIPLAAPGAVALGLKWMLNSRSPLYIHPRPSWELFDWGLKFWQASNAIHVKRSAPLLRDLHIASRACYEALARDRDEFGFSGGGTLMLCKTRHALDDEARTAEYARALGIAANVLDARQTAAVDPNLRMDVLGSVYFPDDAKVVPDRFVRALQRRLQERGVRFAWGTRIASWRVQDRSIRAVASGTSEEIDADEFVLAAGCWSSRLARSLELKLPMQAGKGYSLTLPRPRALPHAGAILVEARVAVTPMGAALRFGGTMELAGLSETVNPIRVRSIIDAIPRYYPDYRADDFEGIEPWHGLRPCSPDGLPYVGRSARYANLCVATGHAMMGVSLGPITGKLVAEVIAGEPPSVDLALLSPDRYA